MIICPNCQAENRSGARFCRNCATRLPDSLSGATRPLDAKPMDSFSPTPQKDPSHNPATKKLNPERTGTQPLPFGQAITRRPPGAIFGNAFLYKSLIYSDEYQNRYLVTQLNLPENQRIRYCPNPGCGSIFVPRGDASERFCTDCGTTLSMEAQDLVLIETLAPIPEAVAQVVARGLSHAHVRAPLMVFEEQLAGVTRYCTIMPPVSPLDSKPEVNKALTWGVGLARGLDYLHDNGISFGGRLDSAYFGLVNDRAVWANFANIYLAPEGTNFERSQDVVALASQIYSWLTGKTKFEPDPSLLPPINRVFERAFTTPGYVSGLELAEALDRAMQEAAAPGAVDFRLGRRTHVGMVRTLNEDSVLTLEINRIQQSVSQPLGVFVVADGMGGHAAGEIASGAIVNTIAQKALMDFVAARISQSSKKDPQSWLLEAVETANKVVYDMRKSAGTDMGSTLVSAVVEGNKAYIAHVGDSRAYLINSNGVRRLTTDHSLVERLIATKQITREEARFHPQRNVIYRTIGDKAKVDVEVSTFILSTGDCLLLCSDGLSGMVDDNAIQRIVSGASCPQTACDELIAAANAAGGDDNISAVIVQIVPA